MKKIIFYSPYVPILGFIFILIFGIILKKELCISDDKHFVISLSLNSIILAVIYYLITVKYNIIL
jgi:hypothetical protein